MANGSVRAPAYQTRPDLIHSWQALAAGLPTLLLGVDLGDHERFENVAELAAQPTDTEPSGALRELD
jgi:hypothetical protein